MFGVEFSIIEEEISSNDNRENCILLKLKNFTLNLMWRFSQEELERGTPSRTIYTYEEEIYERSTLCKFIQDLGIKLKLY